MPPGLRVSLYSTNPIENLFSSVRSQPSRVKNWRSGDGMATRWAAAIVRDAEARFHRIKGSKLMPMLINALAKSKSTSKIA